MTLWRLHSTHGVVDLVTSQRRQQQQRRIAQCCFEISRLCVVYEVQYRKSRGPGLTGTARMVTVRHTLP